MLFINKFHFFPFDYDSLTIRISKSLQRGVCSWNERRGSYWSGCYCNRIVNSTKFSTKKMFYATCRTKSVVVMKPETRKCLTSAEAKYENLGVELFAFRNYRKSNCELECVAGAMLTMCQCLVYNFPDLPPSFVKRFLPNITNIKDIICKPSQLQCIKTKTNILYSFLPDENQDDHGKTGIYCNCPENCDDHMYTQVSRYKESLLICKNVIFVTTGSNIRALSRHQ